jgi:hypothetical protein
MLMALAISEIVEKTRVCFWDERERQATGGLEKKKNKRKTATIFKGLRGHDRSRLHVALNMELVGDSRDRLDNSIRYREAHCPQTLSLSLSLCV